MTIATIDVIIDRIGIATSVSPIAVFRHWDSKKRSMLEMYFESTYLTRRLCKTNKKLLVGIYDKSLNRILVLEELQQAVFKQAEY